MRASSGRSSTCPDVAGEGKGAPASLDRRTVLKAISALTVTSLSSGALAQSLTEVPIAVSSNSFVMGGVRIGEAAGIFERNGLLPRIKVMDSGNAALAALIGGSVPFAVAGPPEVLAARVRQQDIVIVASLYRGLAGSLVLAKPTADALKVRQDAPLAERLKVLKDLTIAVPSPTSSLVGPVRKAASEFGVTMRFTYMAQPAMVAALESGAIQGMVASFPFAGTPVLKGTGVLWLNGPAGDLPPDALPASSSSLQATGAYARENPALVKRVQQALLDIAAFIKDKPDEAKAALAKAYASLRSEEIEFAFAQQKSNWTTPIYDEAQMRQDIALLKATSDLRGLDSLDAADIVWRAP